MTNVRVIEDNDRVVVSDVASNTVLQVLDQRPRVVIEPDQPVRVVAVGLQGPPGPAMPVPGEPGDVLFNGGAVVAVDSQNFFYSTDQQALSVRKIVGTTLDGGNF
jgi:hypothetical protein